MVTLEFVGRHRGMAVYVEKGAERIVSNYIIDTHDLWPDLNMPQFNLQSHRFAYAKSRALLALYENGFFVDGADKVQIEYSGYTVRFHHPFSLNTGYISEPFGTFWAGGVPFVCSHRIEVICPDKGQTYFDLPVICFVRNNLPEWKDASDLCTPVDRNIIKRLCAEYTPTRKE